MKKIFISYSSKDEEFKDEFQKQSKVLQRNEKIKTWDMRSIDPDNEWDAQVKSELQEADIVVLLISADFFASDYIWDIELEETRKRRERGECKVAIVVVRPVDGLQDMWLGKLQALNQAKPISTAPNRDAAWVEVIKGIKRMLD